MTLRLALPRLQLAMILLVSGVMIAVGVAIIVGTMMGRKEVPPVFVTVLWCVLLAWTLYTYSGMPYRIEFDGAHELRFVSLRNTVVVSVMDIESLKTDGRFYVLRYSGGKIRMLSTFTGFYELLFEIKKLNPNFVTSGI